MPLPLINCYLISKWVFLTKIVQVVATLLKIGQLVLHHHLNGSDLNGMIGYLSNRLTHWGCFVTNVREISIKIQKKIIQGNEFENIICKIADILSQPQGVKHDGEGQLILYGWFPWNEALTCWIVLGKCNMYFYFISFLLLTLNSQYYGYWWHGYLRSQGVSRHWNISGPPINDELCAIAEWWNMVHISSLTM